MNVDYRFRQMLLIVLVSTLFPISCTRKMTPPSGPATPTEQVLLGYLPVGAVEIDAIHFELYTHLCHAFVLSDGEGRLLDTPGIPDRDLADAAHRAGAKMLLSLGGWGSDEAFASLAANEASRQRYIDEVIRLVDEYDYDGIDLDWEYPDTPEEVVSFNRLVHSFRSRLDELGKRKGRSHIQTIAVSASDTKGTWLDTSVLLETMDFINVMTYDFAGPWTDFAGHHSAFRPSAKDPREQAYSVVTSMDYWSQRKDLPTNRLVVGVPLYGRGFLASKPWEQTGSDSKGEANPYLGIGYHKIAELLADGWSSEMDEEIGVPWAWAPDSSAVVGYENEDSVAQKVDWALRSGYRGIFFWHIGHDRLEDNSTPLQQKARERWSRYQTK